MLTISSPSAIDPIIDKLVELSEDSHYNNFDLSAVIRFNITGYKEFALKQPKPYHLFVLLSANQGVCKICPSLERTLDRASLSYYGVGAHTDEKDPVFFGVIDAYTNSEIQRVHELKAVPLLVHFGPKSALTKKKRSGAVMIKSGLPSASLPCITIPWSMLENMPDIDMNCIHSAIIAQVIGHVLAL
mmetsp:Transcript_16579/g.16437  ORF Transcript_16579/g.16437 Transcript_16579/m.16437 type:complete len:187 (+) Transcript_16579:16-576(+)